MSDIYIWQGNQIEKRWFEEGRIFSSLGCVESWGRSLSALRLIDPLFIFEFFFLFDLLFLLEDGLVVLVLELLHVAKLAGVGPISIPNLALNINGFGITHWFQGVICLVDDLGEGFFPHRLCIWLGMTRSLAFIHSIHMIELPFNVLIVWKKVTFDLLEIHQVLGSYVASDWFAFSPVKILHFSIFALHFNDFPNACMDVVISSRILLCHYVLKIFLSLLLFDMVLTKRSLYGIFSIWNYSLHLLQLLSSLGAHHDQISRILLHDVFVHAYGFWHKSNGPLLDNVSVWTHNTIEVTLLSNHFIFAYPILYFLKKDFPVGLFVEDGCPVSRPWVGL